jgi:putative SOS response-associated peptidase YedK
VCGRFARYAPLTEWVEALGSEVDPGLLDGLRERDAGPRYNIAPGTQAWIAAFDANGELVLDEHKWAFPTPRGNRINVRSETAHRVPEYKEPYDKHRCVVLASGFYEPKGEKTAKNRPWYFFQPKDAAPLFLGAIAKEEGFSILTRVPVPPVSEIHDRTPVFVPAENVLAWLDSEIPGRDALQRFAPAKYGELLDVWRVNDGAKRVTSDGPELIEPFDSRPRALI